MRIDSSIFEKEMTFYNSSEKNMSFNDVISRVLSFIKRNPQGEYNLALGTDSQVKLEYTVFITAIIIHNIGKGAWGCVSKLIVPREINNLKEKIFIEATRTQQLAFMFTPEIFEEITNILLPYIDKGASFHHEIHIDIGTKGATRKLIKETIGYFAGLGFETKIKPESYAASSYANKYTK